jgi:hypothetical protein
MILATFAVITNTEVVEVEPDMPMVPYCEPNIASPKNWKVCMQAAEDNAAGKRDFSGVSIGEWRRHWRAPFNDETFDKKILDMFEATFGPLGFSVDRLR